MFVTTAHAQTTAPSATQAHEGVAAAVCTAGE
jgi:hypothetical protein